PTPFPLTRNTTATPPRPFNRSTCYLGPGAWARRPAVFPTSSPATSPLPEREGGAGGEDATRSSVITVGDAVPHAGQNAAPRGISLRHDGQVSRVVTGPKICVRDARCKLISPDAGAPDCHWPRALVRRTRAPRLEVPGAARL